MDRTTPTSPDPDRPALRIVELVAIDAETAVRPRSIGRLIAQTALIAESAATRRKVPDLLPEGRGMGSRLLGRFR